MTSRAKGEEGQYDLEDRLIEFTMGILEIVESLPQTRVGNHIASQLVRCGTSPAPNYGEARSAESRKDFIHKMRIVLKELRETRVWLLLVHRRGLVEPPERVVEVQGECNQQISIFASSVRTAEAGKQPAVGSRSVGGRE
jgi:four helix bundle protein